MLWMPLTYILHAIGSRTTRDAMFEMLVMACNRNINMQDAEYFTFSDFTWFSLSISEFQGLSYDISYMIEISIG